MALLWMPVTANQPQIGVFYILLLKNLEKSHQNLKKVLTIK
jgi:hypothetical protein